MNFYIKKSNYSYFSTKQLLIVANLWYDFLVCKIIFKKKLNIINDKNKVKITIVEVLLSKKWVQTLDEQYNNPIYYCGW